ncbi:hypothetical protein K6119_02580 [Paracrocinitomix mangrovi]|uniref:hypothetical protein n=1 Tax=Paracrocinitomix mangrovi TaxID=2862509 RepID=UPI001C8D5787|nr:hypothetical protein [Paracrocinitomix mangrovi]UKN02405.1 hypothetical protein K6119_02580 [Paracrocinitomix mangrovi]
MRRSRNQEGGQLGAILMLVFGLIILFFTVPIFINSDSSLSLEGFFNGIYKMFMLPLLLLGAGFTVIGIYQLVRSSSNS